MTSGVDGVLVGRGVLRNPWILAQAADLASGLPARTVTLEDRGRFLLEYIDLLVNERVPDAGEEFTAPRSARSHDRWVINKVRALGSWYTKGLEGGSHLRTAINSAGSLPELRDLIGSFFLASISIA
jgi:tRNA-dihydrouridine synthase